MNAKAPQTLSAASELSIPVRSDLLVIGRGESTPLDRSVEKRRLRKYYVLNIIREHGPLSRAEIAKQSGLNLPSVSSLVDELVTDGLVIEQKARPSLRGRRPIPVYLHEDAACVLGIDIGKRSTTALLVNLRGTAISTLEMPTPALKDPAEYTDWAIRIADKVFAEAQSVMPPLCGIGIVLPGLLRSSELEMPSLPPTAEGEPVPPVIPVEPLRQAIARAYGVEVSIDNNARIQVAGAKWFGSAGSQFENFAVLNIGQGLGLGVIVKGQVLQGSHGFAGEIGHIPLGRLDQRCHCGRFGCLETITSGAALTRAAEEHGMDIKDVSDLAQLARDGNAEAREIFAVFADGLGKAIATIINLFNPEAIILSGRVARAADVFLDDTKRAAARHALPASFAATQIILEDPAKNLASLGAAAIVLDQIFYSSQVSFEEVI